MKLKELVKIGKYKLGREYSVYGRGFVGDLESEGYNEAEIIVYIKIKGNIHGILKNKKLEWFCLSGSWGEEDNLTLYEEVHNVVEFMERNKNMGVIVNQKEFNKIKKELLLEKLK